MKTPREILLRRHEGMEPKLNAVRHRALAELPRPRVAPSWREWVLSLRWHWAGMSAVWLAVLLLRLASATDATGGAAREALPPARVLAAALVENRRELIELTEAPLSAAPAALPPRRSEVRGAMVTV